MKIECTDPELVDVPRREKLWGERETQVGKVFPPEKPVGNKSPPKQKKGFAADTAEKTGIDKRSINRLLSRTRAIGAAP